MLNLAVILGSIRRGRFGEKPARWIFDECALKRIGLLTEPDNQAMVHAAQAAGFAYEGLLRSYVRERGRRVDCAVLSLLPGEEQI